MKIFDCFMYFDEETVCDIRLNYLNKYVDYFVIVESTFTHKGEKRKLKFNHEKFQDRSPRPTLNFFQFQVQTEQPIMEKKTTSSSFWKTYANSAITRILEPQNHSWQDDLVKEIIRIVLENPNKFRDI